MKHVLIGIMALSILSCKSKKKETSTNKQQNQATVVDVLLANPQNITNAVEANGTVVAGEYVEIRPEISGRLTYLNVREGGAVSRGSVIARINDADLRAQIQKIKVQLDLAQTTVGRYQKLLDINGINRADYDQAVNQVNSLRADINILQAELARTVVKAPFSGKIGLKQVSNGAYVTPQTIIATLQQMGNARIDFTLPETYANLIKPGSPVVFESEGVQGARRRATVIAIEPQISTTTRNVLVRARMIEAAGVNPGSFVKVFIDAGSSSGIMVPTNAIIPDARAKRVVVVEKGKAKYVDVPTGVRQEGAVQVTEGLNAGDSVVVTGVLFARPNAPLKVRSVKTLDQVTQ